MSVGESVDVLGVCGVEVVVVSPQNTEVIQSQTLNSFGRKAVSSLSMISLVALPFLIPKHNHCTKVTMMIHKAALKYSE